MTETSRLIVELPRFAVTDAASAAAALETLRSIARALAGRPVDALLAPEGGAAGADGAARGPGLDPTVVAGILTAEADAAVPLVIEAGTGRHAPFNLARRVQSLARITGGRAGVLLSATGLDPVTATSGAQVPPEWTPSDVRAEYAEVLERLWASFPEDALVGDARAGVLADTSRIEPAAFAGRLYAVAGALNVPLAPESRPALLTDPVRVSWAPESSGTADLVQSVVSALADATGGVDGARDDGAAAGYPVVVLRVDAEPGLVAEHAIRALDALDAAGLLAEASDPSTPLRARLAPQPVAAG